MRHMAKSLTRGSTTLLIAVAAVCFGICCERDAAEDGPRVVTVWAHHGQEREKAAMESVVAAFNETHQNEGLRIQIDFFPDRHYADKVAIAAASGALPDVLDIDGPYVGPWAAEGVIQAIGDLVGDEVRTDMLPSLIEQGTYRGELYALGAFESALVVYYNREMVEKVGIEPPDRLVDAWTWAEFTEALRRVKPFATVPLSLHMDDQSDEWFTYAFAPLIWSNGGRLIDPEAGRAVGVLDSPAAVEAVRKWQRLFREGLAEATSTNPNPFAAGLAAFDWTGHWMLPGYEQATGLRFGVTPLPRMGDRHCVPSGSWCWGLSRDCADRERAFRVLSWLLDPEQGIRPVVQANGAVPGRRSAFKWFPEYGDMPRRLFREQIELAARPRPRTPVYLSLTSGFARALRDIALGSDVKLSLGRAAEVVQRALDRQHDSSG
jgi:ABC-type glycerol-3-phosphate transport system substrate-binding protein